VAPESPKDCFSTAVTCELYGLSHVMVTEQNHVTPHSQIKSRITLLSSALGMTFELGPTQYSDRYIWSSVADQWVHRSRTQRSSELRYGGTDVSEIHCFHAEAGANISRRNMGNPSYYGFVTKNEGGWLSASRTTTACKAHSSWLFSVGPWWYMLRWSVGTTVPFIAGFPSIRDNEDRSVCRTLCCRWMG